LAALSAAPDSNERPDAPHGAVEETRRKLARALSWAEHALLWEKLWPRIASALAVFGVFLAVSWLGLWIALPPLGRVAGVSLFALLFIASLSPLIWLRLPRRAEALARLDHASGIDHRPATALADRLAPATNDPVMEALWRAHRVHEAERAKNLRAGLPRPRLAWRDPYAIRALVLLAAVASFFLADGEQVRRVTAAFDWSGAIYPRLYRVDAWVTPPAYTGRAPILLPGIRHDEPAPGETTAVLVPAGSELVVRATGLSNIDLAFSGGLTEQSKDTPTRTAEGGVERRFLVSDSGTMTVRGLPAGNALWGFKAVPDRPPTIAHIKDPQVVGQAGLSLNYRVEDDYGVISAEARFTRAPRAAADGAPAPRPLVSPPDFSLLLPQARTRAGVGQTTRDLTEHPWAGVATILTLVARDEGGNEGMSEAREIRLPERPFNKLLSRALVEQRRNLALDANARENVEQALRALMIAPEQFTSEAAIYLGLRTAFARLKLAKSDDDLRGVVDYLWEVAVLIEDGTMSDAERELRAAEDALRQALERGAPDEEIRKLTEKMREVLDRFLRALAEQLRRDGTTDDRPLDRNARIVRPQDLKNMLDRIENLARNGSRDAARRLLDEMQAMLDGLSRGKQARSDPGDPGASQLDELSRMIQEEQRLRDKTFRQGRDSRAERRNRPSDAEPSDRERRAYNDLRQNQEGLRQKLEQMLEQLRRDRQNGDGTEEDGPGKDADEALGQAGQAMQDAEGSLQGGDAEGAVDSQGRALQSLRKGVQSLAEAMQGGMGDGMGEPMGDEPSSAERTDPLGRPVRSREYGDDFTVKVPGEIDVQRARRVLEELRRRLGDANRPQLELDYLERLLKDFF
jgi:uncharacterized protein (TIGR02302 family)